MADRCSTAAMWMVTVDGGVEGGRGETELEKERYAVGKEAGWGRGNPWKAEACIIY